jgi:ADP-ribose pyrophosphatase
MPEEQNPWKTLSDKLVYENAWLRLDEFQVINPGGGQGIYGRVHFKNIGLGIIPLDEDLNIWLVGQYRFACNCYSWEIPEGGGALDQDPLVSAKRELLEETGLIAAYWEKLLEMHLSNSVSDERAIIYLAREFTLQDAQPEETEELKIKKVPFEEAYQMVINGDITDSMSVAGILRIKLLINEGRLG